MIDVKKYTKAVSFVAILLLAIYFLISAYKFITMRFERERDLLVMLHLRDNLRDKDLPNGEIKDIPLLFNERVSAFIRGNKYVDRWGNPLDIRIIKTDETLSFTVMSRGDRRFFFYREDIGVSMKEFKTHIEENYFP